LKLLVHQAHAVEGRGTYGSPRVFRELKAKGEHISRKRVIRLMKLQGLKGKVRRRFVRTTNSDHALPIAPNLLAQEFRAERPNQRWVGDITYLRTPNGFIYLAAVLDLYSRAIVGWAVSAIIDRHLVMSALNMAVKRRCPAPGLLHHSDRGSQYASEDYQRMLEAAGITCSMSRRGNCYDNATMESWFGTLKTELGEFFDNPAEAKRRLFDYIEIFYNRKRRHSSLGYVSPAAFEQNAMRTVAA